GCPDRAAQVASPTNRRAAAVGTTRTSWPDSVKSRSNSHALYAAMPPPTPRTTRGEVDPSPAVTGSRRSLGVDRLRGEQVAVDLAEGDGERLLLGSGLHQRPDVLQQALAELAVVRVDLARPLRGEDHQGVLRRRLVE